jgi:hypothetical protein
MFDIILYIIFGFLVLFWINHRIKIADKIIDDWLKLSNFNLIEKKFKFFYHGPFERGSLLTVVYKMKVKNNKGEIKKCWFRIGNSYTGLFFNKDIKIKWIK